VELKFPSTFFYDLFITGCRDDSERECHHYATYSTEQGSLLIFISPTKKKTVSLKMSQFLKTGKILEA
jgi:hypothetical protein